jgi:hypothetical protein
LTLIQKKSYSNGSLASHCLYIIYLLVVIVLVLGYCGIVEYLIFDISFPFYT